jgi:ketosteroid isomerase-like protein
MILAKELRRCEVKRSVIGGAFLLCVLGFLRVEAARGAEGGAASVDSRWLLAMKANDLEGVLACYAPDAVAWLPDAPEARGARAIRDTYAGWLGTMTVKDVSIANPHYEDSGDLSCGWGNYTMTLQPKSGGDLVVMKGRFVEVAKKVGGHWLYAADHASNDPPPATPAPKP